MNTDSNNPNLIEFKVPSQPRSIPFRHHRSRDRDFAAFIESVSLERLHALVALLTPIQQNVIQLSYVNGLRRRDVARTLQKSENYISNCLAAAIDRLIYLRDASEREDFQVSLKTISPTKRAVLQQAIALKNANSTELQLADALTREKFLNEKLKRLQVRCNRLTNILLEEGVR